MRTVLAAALLLAISGCTSTMPSPLTGLTGVVTRGPTRPVCTLETPCEAPFAGGFTVRRDGQQVERFRSDGSGQFTVFLKPGTYSIVPDPDAPIISASSQVKSATVADIGALTAVRLMFDTGIR